MTRGKMLSYDDLLSQYPDWVLLKADLYHRESTPEATEVARLKTKEIVGNTLKFFQDHGLTKRVICRDAPNIPDDLWIYLRDITPEGLDFYRTGQMKWLKRFERGVDADPSDVSVMEKALTKMRETARNAQT